MVKIKVKVKTPSKQKIRRDLRRAFTKNLKCPSCGHSMPTTAMSKSVCPRCKFTVHL